MSTDANVSTPTKPKRRWYQYSLRTLFIIVTFFGIGFGLIGGQALIVRERKAMLDEIQLGGGRWMDRPAAVSVLPDDWALPWYRRLLGDNVIRAIFLPKSLRQRHASVQEIFPEAMVYDSLFDGTEN